MEDWFVCLYFQSKIKVWIDSGCIYMPSKVLTWSHCQSAKSPCRTNIHIWSHRQLYKVSCKQLRIDKQLTTFGQAKVALWYCFDLIYKQKTADFVLLLKINYLCVMKTRSSNIIKHNQTTLLKSGKGIFISLLFSPRPRMFDLHKTSIRNSKCLHRLTALCKLFIIRNIFQFK